MASNDQETSGDPNALVSESLRVGVAVSFALLLAGCLWSVAVAAITRKPTPPFARDPATGAIQWHIVLLLSGLVALMATPAVRLATCAVAYHRSGDVQYARISVIVLVIVLASIGLSFVGLRP